MNMSLRTKFPASRCWLLLSTLTTTIISGTVHAESGDIEWNGFLNVVGGVLKNEPVKDFTASKQHPDLQGYESDFTLDSQTSAGLQAKKDLDEQTSVTLQVYSKGDMDAYQAKLKWLYLTYNPDFNSTFRVGRIGTPVYYFSDSLNVGYSYHWIEPPQPVYAFDTTLTGVDYVFQNVWNNIEWSAEALLGSGEDYLPLIESRAITRNSRGLAFTASTGNWLSFRTMYFRADTTFEMDVFNEENINTAIEDNVEMGLLNRGLTPAQVQAVLPTVVAAVQPKIFDGSLNVEDIPIEYLTVALRAETERWLLMTEISTVQTDTYLFNDVITRYITGGVRFGPVMYHLTIADGKSIANSNLKDDINYTLPQPASDEDYVDLLAARFKSMVAGTFSRNLNTVAVGARIETSDNTAVKFEVIRIEEQPLFDGDTYAVGKNMLFRTALNATF